MRIVGQFDLAVVALCGVSALAQVPSAPPALAFDVAAVKQDKTEGPQHSNVPLDSGNVYQAIDPSDSRTVAGGYLWRRISRSGSTSCLRTSSRARRSWRCDFSYFDGLRSKVPAWVTGGFDVSAERFTIEARAPEGSTIDGMRQMMQRLLADRFQLVAHHEMRGAPALGLVLVHAGVLGPSLRPRGRRRSAPDRVRRRAEEARRAHDRRWESCRRYAG